MSANSFLNNNNNNNNIYLPYGWKPEGHKPIKAGSTKKEYYYNNNINVRNTEYISTYNS